MADTLKPNVVVNREDKHLLQEPYDNKENSFIAKVSYLYDNIENVYKEVDNIKEINDELTDRVTVIEEELPNKAPKNHASETEEYGLGTDTLYGHLKISNDLSNVDKATAISPSAVKTKTDELEGSISSIQENISSIELELAKNDYIIKNEAIDLNTYISDNCKLYCTVNSTGLPSDATYPLAVEVEVSEDKSIALCTCIDNSHNVYVKVFPNGNWSLVNQIVATVDKLGISKPDNNTLGIVDGTLSIADTFKQKLFKYEGSVANESSLPSTGVSTGSVYYVTDTGVTKFYNGSEWVSIGGLEDIDTTPTEGSDNPISSGGVYTSVQEVNNKITDLQEQIDGLIISSGGTPPDSVTVKTIVTKLTVVDVLVPDTYSESITDTAKSRGQIGNPVAKSSVDLDTLTKTSLCVIDNTCENRPDTITDYAILRITGNDTQVLQEYIPLKTNEYKVYYRVYTGSAWSSWESSQIDIDESSLVHVTGNETISGIKTFTDSPVLNSELQFSNDSGSTSISYGSDGLSLGTNAKVNTDGNFEGSLVGNASTATKLAAASTINLTGDVTGTGSFDGSSDVTITTTFDDSNLVHKTGVETIAGQKTLTAAPIINMASPHVEFQDTVLAKGTPVSNTNYKQIFTLFDSSGRATTDRLCVMEYSITAESTARLLFYTYKFLEDATDAASIGVYIPLTGSSYATAPNTPTDGSAVNNCIVTVGYLANSASGLVHITGTETIEGSKTFTSTPVVKKDSATSIYQNTNITKGTNPASTITSGTYIMDSAGTATANKLGEFVTNCSSAGNVYSSMSAYKSTSDSTDNAAISVYYPSNGNPYATAPSTPSSASSTEIVTVDYLRGESSGVVHTSGTEVINGFKGFTNTISISNTYPSLKLKVIDFTRGDVSKTAEMFRLQCVDSSDEAFIYWNGNVATNGNTSTCIRVLKNDAEYPSTEYAELALIYKEDGTKYATAPTTPATANGGEIVTVNYLKGANSGVVHTTGNETIDGTKTFSGGVYINNTGPVVHLTNNSYTLGSVLDANTEIASVNFRDVNNAFVGRIIQFSPPDIGYNKLILRSCQQQEDGTQDYADIQITCGTDGTKFATCPSTPSDSVDNCIVTVDYLSTASVDSANKLSTARTISLSGDVEGTGTFDGSANCTITTSLDATALVKTSGNQTIAGTKTFSSSPVLPTPSSTDNSTKAATTAWVNSKLEDIKISTDTGDVEFYVDYNKSSSGDGKSWSNAYSTLGECLSGLRHDYFAANGVTNSGDSTHDYSSSAISIHIRNTSTGTAITDNSADVHVSNMNIKFIYYGAFTSERTLTISNSTITFISGTSSVYTITYRRGGYFRSSAVIFNGISCVLGSSSLNFPSEFGSCYLEISNNAYLNVYPTLGMSTCFSNIYGILRVNKGSSGSASTSPLICVNSDFYIGAIGEIRINRGNTSTSVFNIDSYNSTFRVSGIFCAGSINAYNSTFIIGVGTMYLGVATGGDGGEVSGRTVPAKGLRLFNCTLVSESNAIGAWTTVPTAKGDIAVSILLCKNLGSAGANLPGGSTVNNTDSTFVTVS